MLRRSPPSNDFAKTRQVLRTRYVTSHVKFLRICLQIGLQHFKPSQVLQLAKDPQAWLLALITTAASIPNGAVGSFQSILISSFGFTDYETTLLQIPGGVIAVISVLTATNIAGKFNARGLNIIAWSAIGGILGGSLLAFLPDSNRSGKLAGNVGCETLPQTCSRVTSVADNGSCRKHADGCQPVSHPRRRCFPSLRIFVQCGKSRWSY